MMGLAASTDAAAKTKGTPKLAILSPAAPEQSSKDSCFDNLTSIHVLAFSMGKPHPSLQLTGAACLASAACIEGTVAHRIASMHKADSPREQSTPERSPSPSCEESGGSSCLLPDSKTVRISHQSGSMEVEVSAASSEVFAVVDRCTVSRTARRLFEGKVYYYQ
jgi:2-methylaconitate cis-trans-isomerase PrpF